MVDISERSLEETIERALVENGPDARPKPSFYLSRERQPDYGEPWPAAPGGYRLRRPDEYERRLCLIPRDVIDFVQATQPKTWTRLQEHYDAETRDRFLQRVSADVGKRGTLDVLRNGVKDCGCKFDLQHSAGSGKSNSIAWLAHQLSILHDANDRRLFDSIVVVTDRRVLDRQLQRTVRQFEQTLGVVENIDQTSRQLKDALESGKTIIVSTLQKFPVIAQSIGELPGTRFALIVDEAHSSQSGESSKSLKTVLAADTLEEAPPAARAPLLSTWLLAPRTGGAVRGQDPKRQPDSAGGRRWHPTPYRGDPGCAGTI